MMERKAWAEAASLQPRPSRYHYAEAITYFARAIGSARSGDIAGARKNVEKLQALRDGAAQAKQDYWAHNDPTPSCGWLACAPGRKERGGPQSHAYSGRYSRTRLKNTKLHGTGLFRRANS